MPSTPVQKRCQAVLFLVSKNWLQSDWCEKELILAHKLNKTMSAVIIDLDIAFDGLPKKLEAYWQAVDLESGRDGEMVSALGQLRGMHDTRKPAVLRHPQTAPPSRHRPSTPQSTPSEVVSASPSPPIAAGTGAFWITMAHSTASTTDGNRLSVWIIDRV